MDSDRLEWHLDNWARYMRSGGLRQFHVEARSVGQGYTHYDTDSSYEEADLRAAQATDAAIGDLASLERAAINAEYLGAKYTGDPRQEHAVLALARHAVRMGLERRGIV